MNHIDVIALLDRLDPREDTPCTVPGCLHLGGAAEPTHDVVAGLRAA